MNAEDWPRCLPKRDWQEVRSLPDAVEAFAGDLVKHYRPMWDSQSPRASLNGLLPGGRKWYLRRETGLWAFARREAWLKLKHFSKDGFVTGADGCACRLQEVISEWGKEAWTPWSSVPPGWKTFIDDCPGIKRKFQLWQWRINHHRPLERRVPDTRIKLYALLFDRAAPVPLEFRSDEKAASTLSEIFQSENWPGKRTAIEGANVRRWRRDLRLELSKDVVAKFPHTRKARRLGFQGVESLAEIDHAAAKKIGLPFDFTIYQPVENYR
jgi:hypothetical protein